MPPLPPSRQTPAGPSRRWTKASRLETGGYNGLWWEQADWAKQGRLWRDGDGFGIWYKNLDQNMCLVPCCAQLWRLNQWTWIKGPSTLIKMSMLCLILASLNYCNTWHIVRVFCQDGTHISKLQTNKRSVETLRILYEMTLKGILFSKTPHDGIEDVLDLAIAAEGIQRGRVGLVHS